MGTIKIFIPVFGLLKKKEGDNNIKESIASRFTDLCVPFFFGVKVEMAYDLLVENALAGEENKMDEFADQCRIIAETTFELEE